MRRQTPEEFIDNQCIMGLQRRNRKGRDACSIDIPLRFRSERSTPEPDLTVVRREVKGQRPETPAPRITIEQNHDRTTADEQFIFM